MVRVLLVCALALFPPAASGQSIGVFMDPGSASCSAAVGSQPWITLYVVFVHEGGSVTAGARFSIDGAPETWTAQNVVWVPDTGITLTHGHPLFPSSIYPNSGGVVMAFPYRCDEIQPQRIPLGRLVILGAPTPDQVRLTVSGAPNFDYEPDCPQGALCDEPLFTAYCTGRGVAYLNHNDTQEDCQVAVEEASWSAVRQLYR